MATSYTRNIQNVSIVQDQASMATTFNNKIKQVINMINTDGPIYSTWIVFQVGIKDPITFNSAAQNKQQNLIASLSFKKSGAGVANSFTLTIQYDPSDMGQDTKGTLEKLDEYLAAAMSVDFNTDLDTLRGSIQYGYNTTTDANLVSPKYTFYLTGADCDVKFESGLTTYTFEGTSTLSSDCEFQTNFPKQESKPLMDIIGQTLYYYYGDENNKPRNVDTSVGTHPSASNFKYRIDIPDNIYKECKKDCTVDVMTGMTPFEYCLAVLDQFNLTEAEEQSNKYSNLEEVPYSKRPRYTMYLTDVDTAPTIRISHYSGIVESSDLKINHEFSWGKQNGNIIVDWRPQVDTKLYLIRKARVLRASKLIDLYRSSDEQDIRTKYYDELVKIDDDLTEMYDAELTILGIPADPPLTAEVTIIPRILEMESRTAGIYVIKGCEDNISTNGIYTTKLELFRRRGLTDKTEDLKAAAEDIKKQEEAKAKAQKEAADNQTVRVYTDLYNYVDMSKKEAEEYQNKQSNTGYQRTVQPSAVQQLSASNQIKLVTNKN